MTSENLERWKRIPGISACDKADRNSGEKRSRFEVRCILFGHVRETRVSHQVEALMSVVFHLGTLTVSGDISLSFKISFRQISGLYGMGICSENCLLSQR